MPPLETSVRTEAGPVPGDDRIYDVRLGPDGTARCDVDLTPNRTVLGYLPAEDPRAMSAYRAHCGDLDGIVIESYEFTGPDLRLRALSDDPFFGDPMQPGTDRYLAVAPAAGLSAAEISTALSDPGLRNSVTGALMNAVVDRPSTGVCLDLSQTPEVGTEVLEALASDLERYFSSFGKTCLIAGPEAGFWASPIIAGAFDLTIVTGFQKTQSVLEPLAPTQWFEERVIPVFGAMEPSRRGVALGVFGSIWTSGSATSRTVSFSEASWLLSRYDGSLGYSSRLGTSQISFVDETRRSNRIWLLDAVSLHNQLSEAGDGASVLVWPLGFEDPSIWPVLRAPSQSLAALDALRGPIEMRDRVVEVGSGIAVTGIDAGETGQRQIDVDDAGRVVGQRLVQVPRPVTVMRTTAGASGTALLTFDGTIAEPYWSSLLDILDDSRISATFFLTDQQMLGQGPALNDLIDRGHTIGLMIRSHAEPGTFESTVEGVFNNGAQQLLGHLSGERTTVVRAWHRPLGSPATPTQLHATIQLTEQGYIPIGSGATIRDIDADRDEMMAQLRDANLSGRPAVLTFDLTSPQAALSVAALPRVLLDLRRDGFSIRSLSEGTNLAQPTLAPSHGIAPVWRDSVTYAILEFWYFKLTFVFLCLLLFAIIRSLIYLALAFVRRPQPPIDRTFCPGVTVIVPAYNESKVIVQSIRSILKSDYPNFEVLVVDDGSSDDTSEAVMKAFGSNPKVRLIAQRNGGKWQAENRALHHVRTPFFVGVDADTVLDPKALWWIVQPFKDERVGAVAGFVEVSNPHNFLTWCQALEYRVSQSVTRRSFEVFNGIFVVPGAIGGWRLTAVEAAGRYSGDTITEDADLTVAVHRAGYKVRFQENARAYTEAPSHVSAFLKQRLRWTLGMLQTSWKHRRTIAEFRPIGVISILDAIWFSLLTSFLSPLVDLLLISILIKLIYLAATGGSDIIGPLPVAVIGSYFVLLALDMVNTLAAFWFEKRFDWRLLLLTPVLRFGYRQLIYISSIHAVIRAVSGRLPGWQKLQRRAAELGVPTERVSMPEALFATRRGAGFLAGAAKKDRGAPAP
ncbi:glycosyltransferase [Loktanella sp. IMCC34160]|uniref:glycosyltransferase n=1 Tax=Loktanella sp. IMCC34160 TaxID=2510646 RepID=UPI0013ED5816|nr:glycosyltransferase [Loktanella sp. IMCC34160]